MSLRDFVPKQEEVEIGDTTMKVTAITITTLARMVDTHLDEMVKMFGGGNVTLDNIVKKSPDFAAALIAQCAGEPDAVEAAKTLPLGAQVTALKTIWSLSQISPDEVGNVIRDLGLGLNKLDKGSEESPVSTSQTPPKIKTRYEDSELGATVSSM